MARLSYDTAGISVRADIAELHAKVWRRLGEPGTWFSGAERVAIIEAVRGAAECALCIQRKAALSPFAVQGEHDSAGVLGEAIVDVVHRVATDPGRLSKKWFDEVRAAGVEDVQYVEAVGVAVKVVCIDSFCRAIGAAPHAPPEVAGGEPSRSRPPRARLDIAWVPMEPSSLPNVGRALTLVPDEAAALREMVDVQYVPLPKVRDFRYEPDGAITRAQMELIASRVSAINECFY